MKIKTTLIKQRYKFLAQASPTLSLITTQDRRQLGDRSELERIGFVWYKGIKYIKPLLPYSTAQHTTVIVLSPILNLPAFYTSFWTAISLVKTIYTCATIFDSFPHYQKLLDFCNMNFLKTRMLPHDSRTETCTCFNTFPSKITYTMNSGTYNKCRINMLFNKWKKSTILHCT